METKSSLIKTKENWALKTHSLRREYIHRTMKTKNISNVFLILIFVSFAITSIRVFICYNSNSISLMNTVSHVVMDHIGYILCLLGVKYSDGNDRKALWGNIHIESLFSLIINTMLFAVTCYFMMEAISKLGIIQH